MKKSVLLIGLGRYGRHVAQELYQMKHDILAVDKDEERVNMVLPYVTNALMADSTNKSFLESLGIRDFDLCIVAIGDDFQSSLETTALLKELGAPFVVARAARDVHARFLARNGADEVIYPERQLAEWTAIRYSSNHILDYTPLSEEYAVYEIQIPANWTGKSLAELDLRRTRKINVFAIKQGDQLITDIHPDVPLKSNQTLMVIGTNKEMDKWLQ